MMRRALICLIALLALAPAEAAKVKPVAALPNVPVWLSEDHTLSVVAMTASLPAGAIYDPAGKSGMAALAANLLDEGAGNLSAEAFQSALAAKGIRLEVETTRDAITIHLMVMSANAKEAFRLLGLALNKPRFDADAVTRVRLQMMQDFDLSKADPNAVAERNFYSLYFGPYTYGRPVGGDPRNLASISAQELRAFAKTHWVQGHLKIAVSGDVTPSALIPLLKTAFGGLPETMPVLPPPPVRTGAPGLHTITMDVPQPAVVFGGSGLMREDRDYIPAMVANYILGGAGSGSWLTREIREKRGLTYDIATDLIPYRRAGLLVGTVATRRDAVRETITVLKEVMRKFLTQGPSDQEVADAKLYLNGSFPLSFTSNADTAAQLNTFQQLGLPLDYIDRRGELIGLVSRDDVRRAARRLFDPDKLTIVVAGSLPIRNTEPADSQ